MSYFIKHIDMDVAENTQQPYNMIITVGNSIC